MTDHPNGDTVLSDPKSPASTTLLDIHEATNAGQRKISQIWEWTQAIIAVSMVMATIMASLKIVFSPGDMRDVPPILAGFAGLVIGSYFQRTNHMNIGGIGPKPTDNDQYHGR